MLVFREGRRTVPGTVLCREFRDSLRQLAPGAPADKVLDLLLRAGELECALADQESPLADSVARVTDWLSAWLVSGGSPAPLHWAPAAPIPERLLVSRPEGFAYYALHPLEYADAVQRIASADRELAVVGVRSIGTTLSAVVAASAQRRARRMTVRPHGHPFNRVLHLTAAQRNWIAASQRAGAHFVIVDEGPGLSGSSFLAVAEALVQAGVSKDRITLLGSTEPDLEALRAPAAAERWARFRLLTVRSPWRKPAEASTSLGEGRWRELVGVSPPPASWICFERQKYRSRDGRTLFKFEGLGPYGDGVLYRARALAAGGFSPAVSPAADGFLRYQWIDGEPPDPQNVTAAHLDRIAQYCAWRASEFAIASATPLETMLRTNLQEEVGEDAVDAAPDIEYRRVAIVDGRMHPHEWLVANNGELMKLDSATHGDDHFFPGSADIAWDLAGAIVEWGLSGAAKQYLIERYATLSGDDPRSRLRSYLLAYAVFRLAYCRLAAESMSGSDDAARFCREAERYRIFATKNYTPQAPSPAVR